MKLPLLVSWAVGMNAAGLILALIHRSLYVRGSGTWMEAAVVAAAFLGGSPGVLAGSLLADRKMRKENVMVRVSALCFLIIQAAAIWAVRRAPDREISFALWEVFAGKPWLLAYLAAVNAAAFALFGIDKRAAVSGKTRIRIMTLLGAAVLGGSAGALAGMYFFRHKTKKNYFVIGIPLIMAAQAAVLLVLQNVI